MRNITVYSTQSCPWCTKVKDYLRQNRVGFREVDVSRDMMGAMEMIRKSGQRGVPVLDIDGNIIVGFDKKNIDRLIGR